METTPKRLPYISLAAIMVMPPLEILPFYKLQGDFGGDDAEHIAFFMLRGDCGDDAAGNTALSLAAIMALTPFFKFRASTCSKPP